MLELAEVSLKTAISSELLLERISFQVQSGDFLGIVGPSGAGKTTLLRLLNRLIDPTSGQIYFRSQPLQQIPVITLRRSVVLVPQEPKLLGMTVENALAYPLQLLEKSPREIKEAIGICLSNLHIPLEWLERYETQLSLGQRQLVSIARALILQPAILLLDEPTSALDMGTASYTLQVLKDLTNNRSLTVIMVNHQLDFVKDFVEKVLYLESGRTSGIVPIQSINWDDLRNKLITAENQKVSGEDW